LHKFKAFCRVLLQEGTTLQLLSLKNWPAAAAKKVREAVLSKIFLKKNQQNLLTYPKRCQHRAYIKKG